MIRKSNWSYWDLLNSFDSKPTNRAKVFEYLIYSICILSDEEVILLRNTIEFIEIPYERYVECVLRSIKTAHLAFPNYLEQPLDIDAYKQIVSHIEQIEQLKNELKNCGFNIFKRIKLKNKLSAMFGRKVSIEQVFNYYFLRVAEENNIKEDELKNFVSKLKKEISSFAQNLPEKFVYLNL